MRPTSSRSHIEDMLLPTLGRGWAHVPRSAILVLAMTVSGPSSFFSPTTFATTFRHPCARAAFTVGLNLLLRARRSAFFALRVPAASPQLLGNVVKINQLYSWYRWGHRQARLEREHRPSDCTFQTTSQLPGPLNSSKSTSVSWEESEGPLES